VWLWRKTRTKAADKNDPFSKNWRGGSGGGVGGDGGFSSFRAFSVKILFPQVVSQSQIQEQSDVVHCSIVDKVGDVLIDIESNVMLWSLTKCVEMDGS